MILIYAGIQPPFDPIILPLFPDLPMPLNWLTNPLIFLAVALAIVWFASEVPPLQGAADRRHDRQAPGGDRGRGKGGRRDRLTSQALDKTAARAKPPRGRSNISP